MEMVQHIKHKTKHNITQFNTKPIVNKKKLKKNSLKTHNHIQLPTLMTNELGVQAQLNNITTIRPTYNQSVPPGFLVWSPECQMPSLDPLAADVMKLFNKEKYEECVTNEPLTRIVRNRSTDAAYLVLDEKRRDSFYYKGNKNNRLDCCYQEIVRAGTGKDADDKFKYNVLYRQMHFRR